MPADPPRTQPRAPAGPALELSRVVRFDLSPDRAASALNGLIGGSSGSGLWPIAEAEVVCRGFPDASGYLVDIGVVDGAVRTVVAPRLAAAAAAEITGGAQTDVLGILLDLREPLQAALPAPLHRLVYRPSPFRSFTLEWSMPNRALISETFEFAASHRLHLAGLSAEENARLFGKCNNPNGHGHNYRIEVAVRVDPAADASARFGFDALARIVRDEVMARFDHRHLNLDCPEFAQLNPSVEHIALVCHEVLSAPVRRAGGELDHVRVWETDKTSCRYPA